MWVNGKKINPW